MSVATLAWLNALGSDPELREILHEEVFTFAAPVPAIGTAEGNGRLDPRNRLNDLTGSEWVFFLNSVEVTAYPTSGPEGFAHDIRKLHPSPKPPQLMRKLVRFFTKAGQWVLDPFAGVGGTLLGAALCDRRAIGIDLEIRYLEAYRSVCEREGITVETTVAGDSRNVAELVRATPGTPDLVDMILTDPPYGDMLRRPQTGEIKKRTGKSDATPFTDLGHDLGNLGRREFLADLASIIESSCVLLKPKGYCVVFCKDLQPTTEHHNMLHADVVEALTGRGGLQFKGYKIWYDKTPTLYPFGYPYAFVANQLHQFILVFRKEST